MLAYIVVWLRFSSYSMTLVLDIEVKSSNQETILELHLIFTIKGVTHALLGLIWYHSEPSDVPYSPN